MQFRGNKMTVHTVTVCALFACAALVLSIVESMFPVPIPIPGVKLGIANVVTLTSMYILGPLCTFWILVVRIILGSIFAGQAISFLYSICGGMMCYFATVVCKRFFDVNTLWALGVIGAICHNIGQLVCAYFLIGFSSLLYYGAVMGLCACITGTFTGLCSQLFVNKYNKINGGKKYDNRFLKD